MAMFDAFLIYLLCHTVVILTYRAMMARPIDCRGQVIWITGASSGIGAALAHVYHQCGAQVIISARNAIQLRGVADAASKRVTNATVLTTFVFSDPLLFRQFVFSGTFALSVLSSFVCAYTQVEALLLTVPRVVQLSATLALLSSGWWLVIAAFARNQAPSYHAESPAIECLPLDVTDVSAVTKAAQCVFDKYDRLDVLVCNAGVGIRSQALATAESVVKQVFSVNVMGCINVTTAAVPFMLKQRPHQRVAICVVSSVQGLMPVPFRAPYAASKHACLGYYRALRLELAALRAASDVRTSSATRQQASIAGAAKEDEHHQSSAVITVPNEVSVTIVCPGYVNTNASINALTATGIKYGQTDSTTSGGLSAVVVARHMVRAVFTHANNTVVLADIPTRLMLMLQLVAPQFVEWVMTKRAVVTLAKENRAAAT